MNLVLLSKALSSHKFHVEIHLDNLTLKYTLNVHIRETGKTLTDTFNDLPTMWELGAHIREMIKGSNGKAKHGFYR